MRSATEFAAGLLLVAARNARCADDDALRWLAAIHMDTVDDLYTRPELPSVRTSVDREASAEQRLVIAQAIAAKLLTRCGLPVTVEWLEERVGSRLARDLVREQQSHADTRARLADALRLLEELQASGRLQSAFDRAVIAVTGRPYADVAATLAATADEDR